MEINSEKLAEPAKHDVPRSEMVMKLCLQVSIVLGVLLVVLAVAGGRSILDVAGSVIVLVSLQWIFYALARAKREQK